LKKKKETILFINILFDSKFYGAIDNMEDGADGCVWNFFFFQISQLKQKTI